MEQLPGRSPVRWGLVLQLGISIALAAYAQHLFAQKNPLGYDSLILYAIAMLLFVRILRQIALPPERDQPALPGWWWQAWSKIASDPVRHTFLALAVIAGVLAARDANQIPHPQPFTFAIVLWLLSVAAFASAFIPWAKVRAFRLPDLHEIKSAIGPYAGEIALGAAITAVAFILRAHDVGNIPINFGGDEGEMGLQARQVLNGRLTNPFATGWLAHPTLFFFLQGISMRLFGENVFGLRMLSAIIGTLTIPAAYLLVRQLHGRSLAAATSALLAVYPYHIQFSRLAINNIADPFWAAAIFYLAARGLMTRRVGYFAAAGLAIGLSQYFYHGVRLVPIILAIFLAYWLLPEWRTARSYGGHLIILFIAALIAALPLSFFYVQQPHLLLERYGQQGIFPTGWFAHEVARTGQNPWLFLANRTLERFQLFNSIPDHSGFYAPGTPLLETFSSLLFVFGLAYSLYRLRERGFFLFVLWFVMGIVFGAVLIIDEAGSARLVTLTVPVMFFVALGLVKLAESATTLFAARVARRWHILVAAIALLAALNVRFYFFDYVPRRTYGGYIGWANTEMAKYLLARSDDYKAYFFGPPFDYLKHATIAFMVPYLNGLDVISPIEAPPDFIDTDRSALFIFLPMRQNEFAIVQKAYPNGRRVDFSMPNGDPLFFVYEVGAQR